VADENGIGVIVTGLSRGQIVDERLSWFYERHIYNPDEIDRQLRFGRQVYHHIEDYSGLRLQGLAAESILDRVKLVDFYRYCDVTRNEIHKLLEQKSAVWEKPEDCGFCSTNCMINDAGIFVHNQERGYHNYESPTAWEVRLGHLSIEAAREELKTVPGADKVLNILNKIGYSTHPGKAMQREQWIVYCVPKLECDRSVLQRSVRALLPQSVKSLEVVLVDELPAESNRRIQQVQKSQTNGLETGVLPLFHAQARQLGSLWNTVDNLWYVLELEVAERLDPAVLKRALLHVMLRHDTLRLRFDRDASGCLQQRFNPPAQGVPLSCMDLPSSRLALLDAAREQIAKPCREAVPLWRMVSFSLAQPQRSWILVVAHEWLADLKSWRIVFDDLEAAYRQLQRGQPVTLPPRRAGLRDFLALQPPLALAAFSRQPVAFSSIRRTVPISDAAADQAPAGLLRGIRAALMEHAPGGPALIDFATSASGGLPPDLSSTAGFFRTVVPLAINDGALQVEAGGLRLPSLRFSWDGNIYPALDSMFRIKATQPPKNPSGYELDIRAQACAGKLLVQWAFATSKYRHEDIERLADRTMEVSYAAQ
jgi:hypothetical protein